MRFIIVMSGVDGHVIVLHLGLEAIRIDGIMAKYSNLIEKLRLCESMVINNRFFIVRVE